VQYNYLKWIKLLRWTAVITTLAALMLILGVAMLMRNTSISNIAKCQLNMPEIYGAVERYRATHDDKYPPDLDILRKEYMKDPSVLICPLDKSNSGKTSYTYTPPKEDADGSDILISCNRHRVRDDFPILEVYITVDGDAGFRPEPKDESLPKPKKPATIDKDTQPTITR
jgi:hypothetical protein